MPIDISITGATQAQNLRVRDAYCGVYNYQEQVEVDGVMVNNPETKAQFANRMLKKHALIDIVKAWETRVAEKAALNNIIIQPLE